MACGQSVTPCNAAARSDQASREQEATEVTQCQDLTAGPGSEGYCEVLFILDCVCYCSLPALEVMSASQDLHGDCGVAA